MRKAPICGRAGEAGGRQVRAGEAGGGAENSFP